ncbi:hypothetical protein [Exiguobacterium sp. S22-S28]|uniref:hypothetical protein n=1 Tax=Exiguobacterium sp. S22-S28 TaxID=3342768 RepID=UPI00372D0A13
MTKVWTTEHLRKEEHRWFKAVWIFGIGSVISILLMISTFFLSESLKVVTLRISDIVFYVVLVYVVSCTFLYLKVYRKVDFKKEGKDLREHLQIKKLSFTKLNDGSYEMHHQLYLKKEMKKMRRKGLSSDEITRKWKDQLVNDFKRLESFIREKEAKGEAVSIHTYTHIRMYKTWIKIARDAGLFFEVIEDNNQKPVGFKWREWKKGVYRTSGKKAKKDSIPKANEWNKYVLTSKDQ